MPDWFAVRSIGQMCGRSDEFFMSLLSLNIKAENFHCSDRRTETENNKILGHCYTSFCPIRIQTERVKLYVFGQYLLVRVGNLKYISPAVHLWSA